MVQHFSNDTKQTKKNLKDLAWPAASTYTSKALEMADAELTLGRKGAKRIVLVMTDGMPIQPDLTSRAAEKVRGRARLVFGAVKLTEEGLGKIQKWATKPTRDNVLRITDFKEMAKTGTLNKIIRDVCTEVS